MATGNTGTNSDKIDQLTKQIADLKASLRICIWTMSLGVLITVPVLAFLVVKTVENSARLEQMLGVGGGGKK